MSSATGGENRAETTAPSAKTPSLGRFTFLDALRAFGALGIAAYHIHRYRPLKESVDHLLPGLVQNICKYGWVGVQMFWVLSGFMMAYSLRNVKLRPVAAGNFMLRRIVRLGIPYWTVVLLVAGIDILVRQWTTVPNLTDEPVDYVVRRWTAAPNLTDKPITLPRLGANMLFLQDILGYDNISAGTWFVAVEVQMSLLFVALMMPANLLLSGRSERRFSTAHVLVLMTLFMPLGLSAMFGFSAYRRYEPWILYFFHMPLFGALAWWALEGRISRIWFWGYAALMAAATVLRQCQYTRSPGLPMFSKLTIALAVATATGVTIYLIGRRGHLGDWLGFGWLQYLGRISYSLFLIHYPVSWAVLYLGCHWTGDHELSAVIWLVVAFTSSIIAAHLFYKFVEAPSLRLCAWMKK
jgi:peptidoglycan/LPS O-acetylase OafA/YrhL